MPDTTIKWPVSVDEDAADILRLTAIQTQLDDYYNSQRLGQEFISRVPDLYLPMAGWIARQHIGQPLLIGINGGQGSGKSTLTGLLKIILEGVYQKRVATLSIDDLYLTKADRQQLADEVHPLFITRGVPGTHDVALANDIFSRLLDASNSAVVKLPLFDKSIDDRLPEDQWHEISTPVDIVIFEGWCVGASPQADEYLIEPVNELESLEDTEAIWRNYVNAKLQDEYHSLFNRIDILMMLKVPSMEHVYEWRGLQESKLKDASNESADSVMNVSQLKRFIMHYERLTRHQLKEMSTRADVVMPLNTQHQIAEIRLLRTNN